MRADETLRQSGERFQLLVKDVLEYAVVMLDVEGHVRTWSPSAERITGYSAEEIVGHHFSRFYPREARAEGWPTHELAVASTDGRFEDEGWRIRKDGSRYWANVVVVAVRDATEQLQGFAKVMRDLTELKRVRESFDQVQRELEARVLERTQELAHANDVLTKEISERQRLERDLRQLVRELRERDHNKNEFLALLAHELRNPLAPMRNAAELLHVQASADEVVQYATDTIDRQVRQMARLIDDLVDLSRLTRNKLQLQKEHIRLSAIVQSAVEISESFIESQNHELTMTLPDDVVVNVDPVRVTQVLSNLLNNAAKFTPRCGGIWLSVQVVDRAVIMKVRDNGIGIAANKLPRVFDMFMQAEPSPERTTAGLGIGLTLVKRLVELHGGTITAHSDGPGRGTEFTVRLPIGVVDDRAQPGMAAREETAPEPLRRRVLVVDDNADLAESLSMVLRLFGADVRTAHDGLEALEIAEGFRPEVVLLDIGLPKLDGYETARRLRRWWGSELFLVAITGWGQTADGRYAAEAAFDHHLVKPVDPVALRALLSTGRRGAARHTAAH